MYFGIASVLNASAPHLFLAQPSRHCEFHCLLMAAGQFPVSGFAGQAVVSMPMCLAGHADEGHVLARPVCAFL